MSTDDDSGFLKGKILIAAPAMGDPRFSRTVLYICGHDQFQAMGLVINQPMHALHFGILMQQLELDQDNPNIPKMPVLSGGPVEPERGFVLHSLDYYVPEETIKITPTIGFSASTEILLAMASPTPPAQALLALGLSSWGPGQVEQELQENAWLICEPDDALIFDQNFATKWDRAMHKIGVDPTRFSDITGHA